MTSARSALVAFLVLLTTAVAPAPGPYDATTMTPAQLLERADHASGTLAAGSYTRTYTSDGGGLHTDAVTKISGEEVVAESSARRVTPAPTCSWQTRYRFKPA